jgi:hypothetical protein
VDSLHARGVKVAHGGRRQADSLRNDSIGTEGNKVNEALEQWLRLTTGDQNQAHYLVPTPLDPNDSPSASLAK